MNLPELEMSLPVMAWLDGLGYVPYAEVPHYASCVDIVGMRKSDETLIGVEMKTGLTKQVIRQAYMTGLFADYSYCAVLSRPRLTSLSVCKEWGVGVLRVENKGVAVLLESNNPHKPVEWNKRRIAENLHLRSPGGMAGKPILKGEGPAQECARRVKRYRAEHPKSTWAEIYEHVGNHYASMTSMRGALTSRGLV